MRTTTLTVATALAVLLLGACQTADLSPWAFPSRAAHDATGLDPALTAALDQARAAAARDGITIEVTSGWRSREHQTRLFREAVARYGSEEEAARWVARPGTSVHEAGEAVDVGPVVARQWLSVHGAGFGLCQVYANEPWHYELRPAAVDDGCPSLYADPTDDPRMQR